LHTNDPVSLVKTVEKFATIQYQKAEDMLRQYQMTQEKTSKIGLVIDSSADLPKEFIDQNQIHIIPFTIQIKNHEYLDRLTIDTADVYRQMRDEDAKVLTSLPNITLAENTFKQLKGTYDSVIAITIASVQSGTYQLFNKAAQKSEISKIKIIDSKKNAIAHGLLVLEAARLIRENWSFQDIVAHIEKIRNFVNIYAVMKDVKYAVRSGRISKNKARIAQFFKLKAIISLDLEGNGIIWKKALGFSSALDKIE
jgi:DegV family protein with EDD domain